jgi:DNA invertase Pin-like site-specific DNA recombinase
MSKTIAYIRVSDASKQDSSAQRASIGTYANNKGLNITEYREFHMSGSKTSKQERGINQMIADLESGDHVIVSDVARLGRDDMHALLNTITSITGQGASLHFAYSKSEITPNDTNDLSKIFITIGEAFAAVKFAQERSEKARTACQVRKAKGLHNGRQKGAKVKSKLDDHALVILELLDNGVKKTEILKQLEKAGATCSRAQLYRWIEKKAQGKGVKKAA